MPWLAKSAINIYHCNKIFIYPFSWFYISFHVTFFCEVFSFWNSVRFFVSLESTQSWVIWSVVIFLFFIFFYKRIKIKYLPQALLNAKVFSSCEFLHRSHKMTVFTDNVDFHLKKQCNLFNLVVNTYVLLQRFQINCKNSW